MTMRRMRREEIGNRDTIMNFYLSPLQQQLHTMQFRSVFEMRNANINNRTVEHNIIIYDGMKKMFSTKKSRIQIHQFLDVTSQTCGLCFYDTGMHTQRFL